MQLWGRQQSYTSSTDNGKMWDTYLRRNRVRFAGEESRRAATEAAADLSDLDYHNLTAAFTRNLFARMNRELGSRIDLDAVEHVARRLSPAPDRGPPPVSLERFVQTPLAAINVGLESFYDSLQTQGTPVVQVDWRPPAGGDEKMASVLAKMRK